MTDRTYDPTAWFETYKDTFNSFAKVQQDSFRTFERFARFQYAVAGDVLDAALAHGKATFGARAAVGTQAIAELLQKQAELGTQLSEKLKARAQEFSALATEVQESVAGSFEAATRAGEAATRAATAAKKAA